MILLLWILLCTQDTYCRYSWKVVHTNNQLSSLDPSDKAIDETKADNGKNPADVEAEDAEKVWANYMDMQAKDGAKPMGKQNKKKYKYIWLYKHFDYFVKLYWFSNIEELLRVIEFLQNYYKMK